MRYGTPEAVTPLTYRSAGPRVEGLGKLPAVESPPLPADSVGFQISARGCSVTLPRDPSEHLYGLGLNTHQFEMTNQRAFIVPSDHPEQPTNESHAPVPFYVSTRGYGVYVDTARFASFYMGDVDAASAAVGVGSATTEPGMSVESLYKSRYEPKGTILVDVPAARGVDVYLFAGPTMLDAVRRYNLFAGGGAVPPLWGLGITYRGQSKLSAEESLQLAKSFRDEGIPCDQWGIEPGWQSATYSSSFVWSKERYPDPDGFVSGMHGLGFRLNAWQHAFVHPISPLYEPLRKWSGNYRVWNGLVPDFATSQGRSIFVDQQEKVLFSKGVDGVKLDECDYQPFRSEGVWSFPEASVFPSGLDGEQMHSLFGELYQQAMLGPFQRRQLRTWGLVRNSHALASPLPYVVYSDSYDHACYIRGLAKSGFCGLLWTPEVRNAQSLEDLYRRVETVIFSPYALINCWYMRMPPWVQIDRQKNNAGIVMPEHQEATETIRRLFKLRMSLIPYLYAAFNEYRLEGTPPVRALVMDWPGDARTALVDNEFMFGRSLLVAPLVKGESHRTVYLPGGEWYDFWSGKRIAGGQSIDVSPPVDQIPLFVRGDTLLPLAEPVEHVGKETQFQLHVHVFGAHPEPMALFDDDGVSEDYGRGVQNRVLLSWDGKEGRAASAGEYGGVSRYRVVEWITEGK
ncbi:MAG TPA: TIM-barrel domain-containing protein [Phycisphaerae bacterium]|nr:TIM-barrel domain-containing protein [Phycisphaerae bacterium]